MINVTVFFDFKTKEEYIDFGEKYFNQKEFIKYTPLVEILKEGNKTFNGFVEEMDNKEQFFMIGGLFHLHTKSEKVLRKLNEFMKEHHYEHNYQIRDNWGNKLRVSFDELFKWWSEIKNERAIKKNK